MRTAGAGVLGLGLPLVCGLLAGCGPPQAPDARAVPAAGVPAAGSPTVAVPRDPSDAAKMICAKDEQEEITHAVGLEPSGPAAASWAAPVYTCTYRFRAGTLILSVRDLPASADTVAYFNNALADADASTDIPELGDGAFATADGSVYVRKNSKVLRVDASRLPDRIGQPPVTRATAAVRVAEVIMGCWTGQ